MVIDLSILDEDDVTRVVGRLVLEKEALLKHLKPLLPAPIPEPDPPTDEPATGDAPEAIEDDDDADGGGEYEDPYAEEPDDIEAFRARLAKERPPAA